MRALPSTVCRHTVRRGSSTDPGFLPQPWARLAALTGGEQKGPLEALNNPDPGFIRGLGGQNTQSPCIMST